MSNKFKEALVKKVEQEYGNNWSIQDYLPIFFNIGNQRGLGLNGTYIKTIAKAITDPSCVQEYQFALCFLLWARDIRGGAGQREFTRRVLKEVCESAPPSHANSIVVGSLSDMIPVVGRWDDLFVMLESSKFSNEAMDSITRGLKNPETRGLVAKWLPREKSSKKHLAKIIRHHLKMGPKEYRKMLAESTNVVETPMCDKRWNEIKFEAVPSKAMLNYREAFGRNAPEAWSEYTNKLAEGKTKVNASAVFPHEVMYPKNPCEASIVTEAMWKTLPDYIASDKKFLPMIDVSGSMGVRAAGSSHTCMQVAIALGTYIAERNKNSFKDVFLSFTDIPTLSVIKGKTLVEKAHSITMRCGYSTNLKRAFESVIEHAKNHNLTQEDMPDYIVVLSDMQFNSSSFVWNSTLKLQIDEKFSEIGLKTPKLIWWNLASTSVDFTDAQVDQDCVAMVGGASPAVIKGVLAAEDFSPLGVMKRTILCDRYVDLVGRI